MIELRNIHHAFFRGPQPVHALSDINLSVREAEFVAVVGPSGCGKSTILNMVAGLMVPTQGDVRFHGLPVTGINRQVGYLTQKDTLLPWRTVLDNIALPLELRGIGKTERRSRARALAERMQLQGFEDYYPDALSGGMKKRAALARTWIYEPTTFLMDEPFGPLDAQMRLILQEELLRLWASHRKTVLFITHDIGEAIALANRVVVITKRPGRIKLIEDVPFEYPRDIFSIRFTPEFSEMHQRLWSALREEVDEVDAS